VLATAGELVALRVGSGSFGHLAGVGAGCDGGDGVEGGSGDTLDVRAREVAAWAVASHTQLLTTAAEAAAALASFAAHPAAPVAVKPPVTPNSKTIHTNPIN